MLVRGVVGVVRGVGLWCVLVGAAGCTGVGFPGGASPSPSSTGIPEDVKVCGFLNSSEVENSLGFVVDRMTYSHSPRTEWERDSGTEYLFCGLTPGAPEDPRVSLWYEPGGYINKVAPIGADGDIPVFDDAKAFENAEGFTIEGVEGEGLTLIDERRSIAMWHYPDDHVLIVEIQFRGSSDPVDRRPQAKAMIELSVHGVVEQAAKPRQEPTVYPPYSMAPGVEHATPHPESSGGS